MPKRYRRKPLVIVAIQFTGDNINEIWEAFGRKGIIDTSATSPYQNHLVLTNVHGWQTTASAGDWIIPDAEPDTFYTSNNAAFIDTYEEIKD
jgi:hypothetical protein